MIKTQTDCNINGEQILLRTHVESNCAEILYLRSSVVRFLTITEQYYLNYYLNAITMRNQTSHYNFMIINDFYGLKCHHCSI